MLEGICQQAYIAPLIGLAAYLKYHTHTCAHSVSLQKGLQLKIALHTCIQS